MSQTSKIVLGIAVVAVVLAGGFYFWYQQQGAQSEGTTSASAANVTTLPSGTATTNTSIDQDLSAIDAQIKAVGNDNASAKTSVDAAAAQ